MLHLWNRKTGEVFGESALFADCDEVRLLFPAQRIERVFCSATGVVYHSGRDFSHTPGSDRLYRPADSRIPRLSDAQLHPAGPLYPAPGARAIAGGIDGRTMLFDARNFFARNQIEVDYTALNIDFDVSGDVSPLPERLPRFRAKLTEPGSTVRIGWLGDSISEGYNASGYLGVSPFQPPFAELTAREIGGHFRVAAELFNHGHNGARTTYPLQNQEIWSDDKPDLLVVAFGMNDFASPAGVEGYLANLEELLRITHSCSADTELLLVASMPGNPAWKNTPLETAAVFSQELRKFAAGKGDAVGFVDLFALWSWFLERKNFLDLTGNGVNHPNDFGHRVLACGVCSTFVQDLL